MKKWRALSSDRKQPYLQRARDNRSAQQAQLRTKKAQQVRRTIVSGRGHNKHFSFGKYDFARYFLKFLFGGFFTRHRSFPAHLHFCLFFVCYAHIHVRFLF